MAAETDVMVDVTFEDDDEAVEEPMAYDEVKIEQDQVYDQPQGEIYQDVHSTAPNGSGTKTDKEMNLQKLLGLFSAPASAKAPPRHQQFQIAEQQDTSQPTYPSQQQAQQRQYPSQGNLTFPQQSQYHPQHPQQQTNAQQNVLLDLFSRARQGQAND